jgi:hypothetical protein
MGWRTPFRSTGKPLESPTGSGLLHPGSYVFIWGLIYLGLWPQSIKPCRPSKRIPGWAAPTWLALSAVANIAWLLLWHHDLPADDGGNAGLLGLLILTAFTETACSWCHREQWFARLPISVCWADQRGHDRQRLGSA